MSIYRFSITCFKFIIVNIHVHKIAVYNPSPKLIVFICIQQVILPIYKRRGLVLKKSMKVLISSLLAISLVFGVTLSFSDAASTSTAKTIETLKSRLKI